MASCCARFKRPCPKKIPETEAIFAELAQLNAQAEASEEQLRLSIDAKARVAVGPFSRRGQSRTREQACDHDYRPEATITPLGILIPHSDELALYGIEDRGSSDCIVDCLSDWWQRRRERFAHVTTLVINLDNGPDNQSHRTQFLFRLVEFVREFGVKVVLGYYPPYHSKFNPVERCWGILERHWNGAILHTVASVEQWMMSMTWRGRHPEVEMVSTHYPTGRKLDAETMAVIEAQVERHETLGRWFVTIDPKMLWEY